MTCPCLSNQKKLYISIQTALLAFVLFNPLMFQAVRGLLGGWISSSEGCPSMFGMLLHAIIFTVILYFLMKPTTKKVEEEIIKTQRQNVPGLPLL